MEDSIPPPLKKKKNKKKAILAIVACVVAFIPAIGVVPGTILSTLGLKKSEQKSKASKVLSIAGIVIASLNLFTSILIYPVAVVYVFRSVYLPYDLHISSSIVTGQSQDNSVASIAHRMGDYAIANDGQLPRDIGFLNQREYREIDRKGISWPYWGDGYFQADPDVDTVLGLYDDAGIFQEDNRSYLVHRNEFNSISDNMLLPDESNIHIWVGYHCNSSKINFAGGYSYYEDYEYDGYLHYDSNAFKEVDAESFVIIYKNIYNLQRGYWWQRDFLVRYEYKCVNYVFDGLDIFEV